jgi:hypothetical protein
VALTERMAGAPGWGDDVSGAGANALPIQF